LFLQVGFVLFDKLDSAQGHMFYGSEDSQYEQSSW
jgi:hypothetical protein